MDEQFSLDISEFENALRKVMTIAEGALENNDQLNKNLARTKSRVEFLELQNQEKR